MAGYLIHLTPAELERIPAPDPDDEPDDPITSLDWDTEVAPYLDAIPPIEADIIELRRKRKTQEDIALVLGMTQAAVSYRQLRAVQRVRFERIMSTYPSLDDLRLDVGHLLRPVQLDAICRFVETTNFSYGLRTPGTKNPGRQGTRSRHRYLAGLERLREAAVTEPQRPAKARRARACTSGTVLGSASCEGSEAAPEGNGCHLGNGWCHTFWHRFSRCSHRYPPSGRRRPYLPSVYVRMLEYLLEPGNRHMRYEAPRPSFARPRIMEGELVCWTGDARGGRQIPAPHATLGSVVSIGLHEQ